MILDKILSIIRAVVYFWVAVEFLSLGYLYKYGYDHFKPTPVIRALSCLLIWIGVFFGFLTFLPILAIVSHEADTIVRNFGIVMVLPIAVWSRRFRNESIREKKMPLPEEK